MNPARACDINIGLPLTGNLLDTAGKKFHGFFAPLDFLRSLETDVNLFPYRLFLEQARQHEGMPDAQEVPRLILDSHFELFPVASIDVLDFHAFPD